MAKTTSAALAKEASRDLPHRTADLIDAAVAAAYFEGLREGVTRYAWWKGGVQYVGTGAISLERAIATIDDAEQAGEWTPT
jgi:hypothetical protein